MVNQSSATKEVLSAGLSLHNRPIAQTKVVHQVVLHPSSAKTGLHQVRVLEQPNQTQPKCYNSCINNTLHNSLILCENCQFGVTASAAIGLLTNAIERSKYVPRKFEEGHSGQKAGSFKPAKVIVVTEATDGIKRKAERKIIVAKRKAVPVPAPSSAEYADESITESVTETCTFPDFDITDEFSQSTTNSVQQELKFSQAELDQMHAQHNSAVAAAQKEANIIAQQKVHNSAGLKVFMISKKLVSEQNFTYNEATQSIKENHPLLYAKWEAEKAEELKENEARYGSKVEIVGDKFQQCHNVFVYDNTSSSSNSFKAKFGLGAIHNESTPPTAAYQLSKIVKAACSLNGHDFNKAEAEVRRNHPELVKMAEAEICVQAQSDHDEFFSCPSN